MSPTPFESVQRIADAVLYEGYVLYPYRASAAKNQYRWQFGVVAPRAPHEDGEPWFAQTECLVARAATGREVTVLRDLTLDQFRTELARTNDPDLRYVINFHRGLLFGKGTGHHSPIGGYLADDDLVFVLDVNEKFGPWLVDTERLFRAMDEVDGSTKKKRGLLRIE